MVVMQQCPASAEERSCIDVIAERPNSIAARVCATKFLEMEEARLKAIEAEIVKALSERNELGFKKEFFRRAQHDWKKYRGSNCGLESALGPLNPTATPLACEAQMTSCRVTQLNSFLSVVANGGTFSANGGC